jgi:hypothetical protein
MVIHGLGQGQCLVLNLGQDFGLGQDLGLGLGLCLGFGQILGFGLRLGDSEEAEEVNRNYLAEID